MVVRARQVMTRRVVTARPDTPVEEARHRLRANRFDALPVVDDHYRPVGIVTILDLLAGDSASPPARTVGAVMTPDPMTMTPDADVAIVGHRLRHYGDLRAMPIADHGLLVGIVTRADLLGDPPGRHRRRRPRRRPPEHAGWPDGNRPGTTAAAVMTPAADVWAAEETAPVADVVEALRAHRFSALPVVDDGNRLLGVVSEADLLPDRLAGRRGPAPGTAGEAMTVDVVTVGPDDPVDDVTTTMLDRGLRLIPVVDDDRLLLGVVGRGDLSPGPA